MVRKSRLIASVLALVACASATAQDQNTPEAWAVVKAGEEAHLDTGTISAPGPLTRFEISIVWGGTAASRPPGYMARRVRYVADCKAGTVTVVAVGLFDTSGQPFKTLIAPPGAVEPSTPSTGTREEKWLQYVCRMRSD